MTIKITKEYYDKKLKRWVMPDETFDVDAARGRVIVSAGYATEAADADSFIKSKSLMFKEDEDAGDITEE